MRTEFLAVASRKTALRRAPWAAIVVKVDGGYMAFESVTDHATWMGQR